ncbi:hypothetical protein MJO28_005307 [Puccinia striiformis f. sp. tritici]|uniref:Uncharacterized protein n=1 Tax=Puccinia striiformis f. sp. tritici TaxID=168172 RepID=A0ACC0EM10_9BASI|nr:hypothetical protein MJO28_005307 [Puccinia striiformis f. sp. tritici]
MLMNTSKCQLKLMKDDQNPFGSSPLSSLSSVSDYGDVLDNQTTAPPKEGQLITANRWVPIATSLITSSRKKKKENKSKGTVYILTSSFPTKISTAMGAHLRNGRNISAEQQQRNLEHQSKFPISPAAAERLRRVREQLAASTGNRENLLPSGSDRFQSRSIAEGHQSVHDLPSSSIEQIDPNLSKSKEDWET